MAKNPAPPPSRSILSDKNDIIEFVTKMFSSKRSGEL
jgi:hypothetical protein